MTPRMIPMIQMIGMANIRPMMTSATPANKNMMEGYPAHVDPLPVICHHVFMAVITTGETDKDLQEAREHTRQLAYGELITAVFPIRVGPGPDEKAWYKVVSLRPLRVQWMPFSPYQVEPEALANLSKSSIYRLIEADI